MEFDHREKGEGKRTIFRYFIFWTEVLGLNYPTKEPPSFPTFQVKARLYVNFIAVPKYSFLDSFLLLLFCVQNICCNDSKYHSLNWKDVSVTNVDIEEKQFSLQFFYSLLQVYIVHRVSYIFYLNVFLVSVCTKGFVYLLCWPRGRGIGLVCTGRLSFHEFYNFLLFIFLILIFFWKTFFLPTTFTHTHTHDPRPLPTTHDPRHLATLLFEQLARNLRSGPILAVLIHSL